MVGLEPAPQDSGRVLVVVHHQNLLAAAIREELELVHGFPSAAVRPR
jgi:hypothetical protein